MAQLSLRQKVQPSTKAKFVTTLVFGTTAFVLVRRIPRPLRPAADLALAAASPWVAGYLTQLGL